MWLFLRLLCYIGFALFFSAIVGFGIWGVIGFFILAFLINEMLIASIEANMHYIESKNGSKLLPFIAGIFIGLGLGDDE